ncbi:MAG TPA: DUF397 domain-containing protein [Streptosporangiaceae bacterium]|nr:DUF397 domain-containing protein [Streptosporangiaceae bacterium]
MDLSHLTWRKATYSGNNGGGCVEIAHPHPALIAVRDSKDPDGPELAFPVADWAEFTRQVKAGQFDLA